MFPRVEQPVDRFIAPQKKGVKEPRKRWHPRSYLITVEPPKLVIRRPQSKLQSRKYCSIRFRYMDGQSNVIKSKTIFFGDACGEYVVDNNQQRRQRRFLRLGHQQDPFHPNYWRLHILNSQKNLNQAYVNFIRKMLTVKPGNDTKQNFNDKK